MITAIALTLGIISCGFNTYFGISDLKDYFEQRDK